MSKVPLTARGAAQLKEELLRLKLEERPKVTQAIATARAHGDLKENAEYHAAKEQQGLMEARIRDIEAKLSNAQIIDVTAVDYLHYPDAKDRFGIVYVLANTASGERVIVRTYLNEPDLTVPSAFPLWKGADWMEREVFDMYGVVFEGHPDLRRILMPEEFTAYPLRKDYPLRGRGERHNFPVLTRAES